MPFWSRNSLESDHFLPVPAHSASQQSGWQTGTGVSVPSEESSLRGKKNVRKTGIHLITCRHPRHRASHIGCLVHREKESLLKQSNKDKIGQVTALEVPIFLVWFFAGAPRVTSCDGSSHTEDNKGKRILITLLFIIIWDEMTPYFLLSPQIPVS